MASFPPKKNTAFTIYLPILDADGDPVTAAAALTSQISGDGAVFAAGPTPVEEGEGFYSIALTAANMNFDNISGVLKTTTSGAKNTPFSIYTVAAQMDDLVRATTPANTLDVNATGGVGVGTFETGAITAAAFAAGAIDNAAFNVTETLTANPAAGGIVAASFGAGAIDAAAIATDAIGAAELAAGAVDKIVNAVWDETTAEARVAATYGQLLKDNVNATVSSRAIAGDLMGIVAAGITAAKFAAGAIDAAAIATDAIGAAEMSAGAANKIADSTLRRTYANARVSADGDAVNFRSLLGAVGKLVNKWSISGTTLTVTQEDDVTSTAPGGTQTVTATVGADPITALDTV